MLARTLVELADSLVEDFDVVELLTLLADRCVDVIDVAAAGLMLASPDGELRVIASSSEAMRVLELLEVQADEGPCVDCYRTGEPIVNLKLDEVRWPLAPPGAEGRRGRLPVGARPARCGCGAGPSAPSTCSGSTRGACATPTSSPPRRLPTWPPSPSSSTGRRATPRSLNEQLTQALNTRIVIEQAKGVVAERADLDMEHAFARLRRHARNHNLRLTDVAQAVSTKALSVSSLDP